MSALADAEARQRIVEALDESQIVEAAAGTGKTRILVARMLQLLRSGRAELSGMVVVTFTEKAAGELKLRVREELERERLRLPPHDANGVERVRLERALSQLEEAHIGTIHGFCADILREYPVQAGVDPSFVVLGEDVFGPSAFEAAFRRWFDGVRHALPEGMRRVLRRQPERGKEPLAQLIAAAESLREHRDLEQLWTVPPFDLPAEVDEVCNVFVLPAALVAKRALAGKATRLEPLLPLITLAEEIGRADAAGARDHEQLEARLWTLKLDERMSGRGALQRELREALALLKEQLVRFRRRAGAQLAPLLQRELREAIAVYEQEKQQSGALDFMDLLLRVRDLLRNDAQTRAQLRERFTHILVDEFQDTDPLQAEILLLLASNEPDELRFEELRPTPGKLFLVGDPKQSIYRFRRADVQLYERIKQRLAERGDAALLYLTSSFRAVPALQQAVNAAFAPLMTGRGSPGEVGYVPLSPFRAPIPDQPALVALPVPDPYGASGRITQGAIRASEPKAVGAWVAWLLGASGLRVSSRRGPELLEPVAPHHVCLLFRHLRGYGADLTRPYVEALEQHGVAHAVVGGRSYFAREEVDALITALRVIEWPGDELSVYAALRGPLFGFDDETLWLFRKSGGRFHARRPGEAAQAVDVTQALALLGDLHPGRNHRPLSETVGRLLGSTRCLAGFALRPNGEQAVSSLLRLQDLARRFERGEALSFRAFVQHIEAQADAERADADAPLLEEGSGGVRLMSVHKAKGLEFPVVVLCDVCCSMPKTASRLTDRAAGLFAARLCECEPLELVERQAQEIQSDRDEALRLLYVAATRARDVLAVPALPEKPSVESWLAPFDAALERQELLQPASRPQRPDELLPPLYREPPAAGVHRPRAGEHRVTWWDVEQLRAPAGEVMPLRHWELIKKDGTQYAPSVARFAEWLAGRRAAIEQGSRASCHVLAATGLAHDSTIFTAELVRIARAVRIERVRGFSGAQRDGAAALRFGTLVHGVLERIDLQAPPDEIQPQIKAVSALCARIGGASTDEAAQAAVIVTEALSHPLLQRAHSAARLFREAPLLLRFDLPGEPPLIVDGVMDLVGVDSDESVFVVDYKTDGDPPPERVLAYRRQVALYCMGLARQLGKRVEGHVLFV